ncbi:MAG TPA: hypothetical protein VFA10_14195 [Ktedonobacteraceae bacterium]|nr:hypothetical protein [Ktedonobacteraceae bacterium]
MIYPQHPLKKRVAIANFYQTFTIVIVPVALYILQLFGMGSSLATYAAGVLVLLKILVEWRQQHQQQPAPQHAAPIARASLVPAQAPLAGCYLCHQLRPLRPYQIAGHQVGICEPCHHCLHFTQQADRQAVYPYSYANGAHIHQ